MQIGILEPYFFSEQVLQKLCSVGEVSLYLEGNRDGFISEKEALFIRLGHYINRDFLNKAKQLRFLCSPTTGLNHIELDCVRERGIVLLTLRGESAFLNDIRATPEHTLGLILAILRKYALAFCGIASRDLLRGDEIYRNKIGVIGYGRVGRILSGYLKAMGAEVSCYDIKRVVDSDVVIYNDLELLISSNNIIVMCASFAEGVDPIINKSNVDLLQGKFFINTARGELVDEVELLRLVRENKMKGVALDVVSDELGKNHLDEWMSLRNDNNIIITPHIGGATWVSMEKTEMFLADKLIEKIRNEK